MAPDHKILNAQKRSDVHRKSKREKAQKKLTRRMETKKLEKVAETGAELKKARLAANIPRTIENTRQWDSSSYLTANPETLAAAQARAYEASGLANPALNAGAEDEDDDDEDEDEDMEGDDQPEAGPSTSTKPKDAAATTEDADLPEGTEAEAEEEQEEQEEPTPISTEPPRILMTTSPRPTKATYAFCEELRMVFPGGEFFKRPTGRGFELGRVARWAGKRGYQAVIVVNEDHKAPNAITVINLPAGPTAYFKLTSVQLGAQIAGHARPSPHSPELILNNFQTLLGLSVGRLFGSLFPPLPQFRGRQVVTLHNQRDFLFFRRHRYMFSSPTAARLQEIGPRFTLKLRWLRKGLPTVSAGDGMAPGGGDPEEGEVDLEDEKDDEEAAMKDIGKPQKVGIATGAVKLPALDEEQEYEWKWKPKMEVSRRTFFL